MEVHLDLVGGLAGDMFIAALLDAFPQYESLVLSAIESVDCGYPVSARVLPHHDATLQGRRFEVVSVRESFPALGSAEPHVAWRSIRTRLDNASLSPGTRRHALGIFQLLADAEAYVHGVDPDTVEFHEVGAWDSIADIVGAAALIDAIGATRWSASPAPLGFGRVKTAHGLLPIPAPATARLLIGIPTLDDGIGGERVTPTGAAILRYLCLSSDVDDSAKRSAPFVRSSGAIHSAEQSVSVERPGTVRDGGYPAAQRARRLVSSGAGFGRRTLPGVSNHVRALCFEPVQVTRDKSASITARDIEVVEFEVDDQSGEDLATGLARVRKHTGVLDVTQSPVFGKKGRMMMHVCVLARGAQLEAVVDACFRETTTIGLRHHTVQGLGLKRRIEEVVLDGQRVRVKVVERPGGATAKTESDDVLAFEDHARRALLRSGAERAVLQPGGSPDAPPAQNEVDSSAGAHALPAGEGYAARRDAVQHKAEPTEAALDA